MGMDRRIWDNYAAVHLKGGAEQIYYSTPYFISNMPSFNEKQKTAKPGKIEEKAEEN